MKAWGVLLILLSVLALPARGDHLPPLRIAVPAFAPFAWQDDSGRLHGALVRVVRQIQAHYSERMDVVLMPYARFLEQLRKGQLDAALIFDNPALENHVIRLGPVSRSRVLLFCSSVTPGVTPKNLDHLGPLAVIQGASFGPAVDDNPGIRRVEVATYRQGWRMLQLGRVNGIVGSEEGLLYAAEEAGISLKQLPPPMLLGEKEWILHLSRQSLHYGNWAELDKAVKAVARPALIRDLVAAEPAPEPRP